MIASFIIPAYNASKTIVRCLDSIYALRLDRADFEIIVIDDCSIDDTVELVKAYASQYDNLKLLCQTKKLFQGAGRNRGVAEAKGKFIVFVDSDDETADGVVSAIGLGEEKNLDMVAMKLVKVLYNGQIEEKTLPYEQDTVFSGIEMQIDHPFWNSGSCAYIYRKSFLKEVNYPFKEKVLYEDSDFVYMHMYHANRMGYCNKYGYRVHYNAGSTTQTLSSKHLCDYALLGTRMLRFYESIKDKSIEYASWMFRGGCYNVKTAFHRLFRLHLFSEIRAFYEEFDAQYERKLLLQYHCWNCWVWLCLKYRRLAIAIIGLAAPFVRFVIGITNMIKSQPH